MLFSNAFSWKIIVIWFKFLWRLRSHWQISIGSGYGLAWQTISWTSDNLIHSSMHDIEYITRFHCVNSSSPGQNGRHFPDDIFKCVFMNEKFCILIQISLKFVTKDPIKNIPAYIGSDNGLGQIRQQAIIWTIAHPIHWCIYATLGWDELNKSDEFSLDNSTSISCYP